MLRISQIKIAAEKEQRSALEREIHRQLRLDPQQPLQYKIVKKSIDARKKPSIFCIYTVEIAGIAEEAKVAQRCKKDTVTVVGQEQYPVFQAGTQPFYGRPVVIGSRSGGVICCLNAGGTRLSASASGAGKRCGPAYCRCREILADRHVRP